MNTCNKCGQKRPAYYFYSRRGKTTNPARFFFVNIETVEHTCFDCNGGYRCLGCGKVKTSAEFRVGGRFCHACKTLGIITVLPEANARIAAVASGDSLNAENDAESGADE